MPDKESKYKNVRAKMSVIFYEDGTMDTEFVGNPIVTDLSPGVHKIRTDFMTKHLPLMSMIETRERDELKRKEETNDSGRKSETNGTA